MNKAVAGLAVKVGKMLMSFIAAQIVKYLSSEEFEDRVKKVIRTVVNQLVSLVMAEKKALTTHK